MPIFRGSLSCFSLFGAGSKSDARGDGDGSGDSSGGSNSKGTSDISFYPISNTKNVGCCPFGSFDTCPPRF